MARVTFVKAARKDNPVAKKGESYYWWKPMVGGRGGAKRYSKERPKPSQLTQSPFLGAIYSAQEGLAGATNKADIESFAEAIREAGQEENDKYENMPEGLQQGDTGQLLSERASQCDEWADEIDRIASDLPDDEESFDADSGHESYEAQIQAAVEEADSACPF